MKKFLDIKKTLNLLIQLCLTAVIFFVPIFFAFFVKTNNVFELNKYVLFKILVLLAFFFYFLQYLFYGRLIRISLLRGKIKKNLAIVFVLFLYLFAVSVSTFSSSLLTKSLWGTYQRQLGLEAFFYFFLFFILLLVSLKDKKQIQLFLRTLVFSSFIVSTYAIIQAFGFDTLSFVESTKLRVISSLGQPNFLGAFLLLTVPLNLYFFILNKKFLRYFYILFLFTGVLALGYTYSLSSWIGGAVSFILLFSLSIFQNKTKLLKKLNYKYLIISFLFLLFALFLVINNSYIFKAKVNSVLNFQSGSTAARINYWQASFKAIKKKPIVGYGLDTQGEILPKYYETDWGVYSNVNVRPDRAHNIILDILLTTGFLGLFSYLLLLFLLFRMIFLNVKNKNEGFLSSIIGISFIGYFVSLLFNFSILSSEIVFWFYFAIILKIYFLGNKIENKAENVQTINPKQRVATVIFKIILLIFFAYLLFGKLKVEINKIIADKYYLDIRQSKSDNNYFKTLVLFDYLKDISATDLYDVKFGQMLSEWTPEMEQYGTIYTFRGAEYMLKALENISGTSYEERLSRGSILSVLSRNDDKYLDEAEKTLTALIDDYPGIPRNYYQLASFYFNNEEYDRAERNLKLALLKIPSINNKNLNPNHLRVVREEYFGNLMLLGDIYQKKGDFETARYYYEIASNVLEKSIIDYKLSNLYKEKGDFEKAIWYNKRAVELDANNHIWYYYLAKTYFENNDFENSMIELNKGIKIFPLHSDSNILKKEIEDKENLY